MEGQSGCTLPRLTMLSAQEQMRMVPVVYLKLDCANPLPHWVKDFSLIGLFAKILQIDRFFALARVAHSAQVGNNL